jgi:hypothetical protein
MLEAEMLGKETFTNCNLSDVTIGNGWSGLGAQ